MNGAKLFAASLVVFALTLGFFLGNICSKNDCCCNKAEMACCKKMEGMCNKGPHGAPHPRGDWAHHRQPRGSDQRSAGRPTRGSGRLPETE